MGYPQLPLGPGEALLPGEEAWRVFAACTLPGHDRLLDLALRALAERRQG